MRLQARCLTLTDLITPVEQKPAADRDCMIFSPGGAEPAAGLSRSELARRSRAIAYRLRQHAAPGSRALIALPTSPEFFTSFFGCVFAGIIAVPVQAGHNAETRARVELIAHECGAALFLTSTPILERIQVIDPAFWHRTKMKALVMDELDSSGPLFDEPEHFSSQGFPAYLQLTSGSTGTPRGVMVSHANVVSNLGVFDEKAGRPRAGAVVSWLPLYHDMGLVSALYALYADLKLVLLPPTRFIQQPWLWLEAISRYRAVCSGGPNFAYDLCSRIKLPPDALPLDLSSWHYAYCGAELVRTATLRRFAEAFEPFGFRTEALSPGYGLAESTLMVTCVPTAQKADVRRLESACLSGGPVAPATESEQPSTEIFECGTPGSGHRVQVVDPERGRILPDRHVGEIWVSGPSKALGYWQRPEESRATFEARLPGDEAGYLRTGDLGFMDAGRLYVTGRIKELIIVRGHNFHPHEIEEAVRHAHPALSSTAAAFALTTEFAETLIVVIELRRSSLRRIVLTDVLNAIQDEMVRRLNISADVIGLVKPGGIPRTTSGKVQRLKCREQYRSEALEFLAVWPEPSKVDCGQENGPEAPKSRLTDSQPMRVVVENWILQWLSFRLRIPVEEINRRQPLSSYGLDSLSAVQLSQAIEDWLEVPVPETLTWSYPTVEQLSAYLQQALGKTSPETATAPRRKGWHSQVELALKWVERLSEPEVEHLYRLRLIKE